MAIEGLGQTANNTLTSVVSDSTGVVSDKMMQIALIFQMEAEAEGSEEQGSLLVVVRRVRPTVSGMMSMGGAIGGMISTAA